jgi:hypothetical protein
MYLFIFNEFFDLFFKHLYVTVTWYDESSSVNYVWRTRKVFGTVTNFSRELIEGRLEAIGPTPNQKIQII